MSYPADHLIFDFKVVVPPKVLDSLMAQSSSSRCPFLQPSPCVVGVSSAPCFSNALNSSNACKDLVKILVDNAASSTSSDGLTTSTKCTLPSNSKDTSFINSDKLVDIFTEVMKDTFGSDKTKPMDATFFVNKILDIVRSDKKDNTKCPTGCTGCSICDPRPMPPTGSVGSNQTNPEATNAQQACCQTACCKGVCEPPANRATCSGCPNGCSCTEGQCGAADCITQSQNDATPVENTDETDSFDESSSKSSTQSSKNETSQANQTTQATQATQSLPMEGLFKMFSGGQNGDPSAQLEQLFGESGGFGSMMKTILPMVKEMSKHLAESLPEDKSKTNESHQDNSTKAETVQPEVDLPESTSDETVFDELIKEVREKTSVKDKQQ
jgi:hypothetical protein